MESILIGLIVGVIAVTISMLHEIMIDVRKIRKFITKDF